MQTPALLLAASAISLASLAHAQLLVDARKASTPNHQIDVVEFFHSDVTGLGLIDLFVSARGRAPSVFPSATVSASHPLYNDGNGRYLRAASWCEFQSIAGDGAIEAVEDMDADGTIDILWEQPRVLRFLSGRGNRVFTCSTSLPTTGFDQVTAVGDLNGDSRSDLLLASRTNSDVPISVYFGSASGPLEFQLVGTLPGLLARDPRIELLDLEGDGDLDVFVGRTTGNRVFENDGTGQFVDVSATAFLTPSAGANVVHVFDHDLDGDTDLLIGGPNTPDELLENDGSGRFAARPSAFSQPMVSDRRAFASGDLDGDGDIDVVVGTENGAYVWNHQAGIFTFGNLNSTPIVVGSVTAVSLCDVDRDNDLDLVVGHGLGSWWEVERAPVQLFYNDGTGNMRGLRNTLVEGDRRPGLAAGDYDGDSDIDLLDAGATLHLNDGAGNYTAQPIANPNSDITPFAADLNGDGLSDVVQMDTQAVEVWLNSGGAFATRVRYSLPLSSATAEARDLEFGDFDGDGDLDVFVSLDVQFTAGHPDVLMRNDGAGGFVLTALTGIPNARWLGLATGDIDGDGDIDVLRGDEVLLNDGFGGFSRGSQFRNFFFPSEVELADMDGDGHLDLLGAIGPNSSFTSYYSPVPDMIAWNDGSGLFGHATTIQGVSIPFQGNRGNGETYELRVGDLNGDGLLDIVRTGRFGTQAILNEGQRSFRLADASEFPQTADQPSAVTLFDADRDGDLDVLTQSSRVWNSNAGTRLFSNLTRQLRAPYLARTGRPYELELHGAPSGGALLLSLVAVSIDTPFGVLGVSPSSATFVTTIPAGDPGRFRFVIPASTGLLGVPLHWQAIDASALRFTNRVTEIVSTH